MIHFIYLNMTIIHIVEYFLTFSLTNDKKEETIILN